MTYYLYLITTEQNQTKIGISGNIERRFKALQASNPQKLKLSAKIGFENRELAQNAESALHKFFDSKRIHYEWFDVSSDEIISIIELVTSIAGDMSSVSVTNNSYAIGSNLTKSLSKKAVIQNILENEQSYQTAITNFVKNNPDTNKDDIARMLALLMTNGESSRGYKTVIRAYKELNKELI